VAEGRERPLEVDPDHRVPLVLGHVEQHPVPQDASVVDENVEAAEDLDRLVDQSAGAVPVGDVVGVGDGDPARGLDLVHDGPGRAGVGPAAGHRAAQVVDHDVGTLAGQLQGVSPPDAPAGAGDDGDPPRTDAGH
jgi:hypothetical protein